MLSLLRQPLLKSTARITRSSTRFGVKNVAQPIPRVLQRSYGKCSRCTGCCGNLDAVNQLAKSINCGFAVIGFGGIGLAFIYVYHFIKNVMASPENKIPVQQRVHDCLVFCCSQQCSAVLSCALLLHCLFESLQVNMLGLLRQPLLKSTANISRFGVKNVAQPIPRVLQRSYGKCSTCGCSGNLDGVNQLAKTIDCAFVGFSLGAIIFSAGLAYDYIKDLIKGPENKKSVQEG
ncbi:uncharacterized protein LOC122849798 [Aphidius gifuensis]|uniref:uncharacterized protein LOC122849798 n=1 Tax=Aphidius gifuensis TaxID=684658 RepID=UPI001CDBA1A1|nr:uncharacterized protein LOC122849798 [Aphidius gifuensis]